jgi:hypothetical protein
VGVLLLQPFKQCRRFQSGVILQLLACPQPHLLERIDSRSPATSVGRFRGYL